MLRHIKFMQCLTGMVLNSTEAILSLQNNDVEKAILHLEKAKLKFDYYVEAIQLGSRGKWQNWYFGEKKLNVKKLQIDLEIILTQLKEKK